MMTANRFTALVIINPRSRRGGEAEFDDCLDLLTQNGIQLIKIKSHSARQMSELINMHRQRVDLIILAGGDGTIHSAAEAIYQSKLPFAILPLGTANDLARSLKLPTELSEACKTILADQRHKIDLARVNGHYFFNAAHIGLGVEVTHELTPEVKKQFGILSYFKTVFSVAQRKQIFRASIVVDGRVHRQRSMHIAVGNGRYYGGGNVIDENATIDNGLLCLYSLKPQGFWSLLTLAPLLRNGMQRLTNRAFCISGRRIEIKTRRPMEIHADGEPVSHTPAVFEILPGAIEVIAPGIESPQNTDGEKRQVRQPVPA